MGSSILTLLITSFLILGVRASAQQQFNLFPRDQSGQIDLNKTNLNPSPSGNNSAKPGSAPKDGSGDTVGGGAANKTSAASCQVAAKDAKSSCMGVDSMANRVAMGLNMSLNTLANVSQDALSRCRVAQALGATGVAVAGIRIVECQTAVSSCVSTCSDELTPNQCGEQNENKAKCNSIRKEISSCKTTRAMTDLVAGLSAVAGGMQIKQGIDCAKWVKEQEAMNCLTGDNAANNPVCVDKYCPAHPMDHMCQQAQCQNAATAMDNPLCVSAYCAVHSNDTAVCPNGSAPPNFTPTSPGSGGVNVANGSGLPDTQNQPFGNSQKAGVAGLGSDGGGGGGGPGGAGGYPGGAAGGAGGGSAAGPHKTDIGGGLTNGGGGGFNMVGVATEGGGGGGRGAAGSAYKSPFDLSKYLPGGENDPNAKRAPASADLRGQGITAAGDVSNFEKINRIMQRKRAMLKP